MVVHVTLTEDQFLLVREGVYYDFPHRDNRELYYKIEWSGLYYRAKIENSQIVEIQQVEPRVIDAEPEEETYYG